MVGSNTLDLIAVGLWRIAGFLDEPRHNAARNERVVRIGPKTRLSASVLGSGGDPI